MPGPRKKPGPLEARLRSFALSYPEAREEFPWGERAFKVAGKTFVFLSSQTSAICTADEDTIVVRGRDLCKDLIGKLSFSDYFYLLLTGKRL